MPVPKNVPTYPRGYGLLKIFAHLKKIFKSSRNDLDNILSTIQISGCEFVYSS
jgi:hypothetical protein